MKKLIILTLTAILCCNGTFSSNKHSQSVPDDPSVMYKKRTYNLSNDSVKAVLKVIQYSKASIN